MGEISTKCSKCGAELKLNDDREFAFCQYCGNKLIISTVQRSEHTTIIKNEADIIRANIEAKAQELEEKKRKQRQRTNKNR